MKRFLSPLTTPALAALALAFAALPAAAESLPMPGRDGAQPLPRFISLRADEVNLRTGPGIRYPVEWVYLRRNLPVEVIAEFQSWRKIRDWQGTEGWVHQSMLAARRTIIVTKNVRTLRRRPDSKSAPVARAEPGVVGDLLECPNDGGWCRVEVDGFEGWLRRVDLWGVYRKEVVD